MAQQKIRQTYVSKKKKLRSNKLRPLNIRKTLGPKSGWRGMKKKKRGQGA
jgi:hypothetical protein|tara:strand:+ start:136 stop:285 length:150 start_codon:yes stop_codon:yes gene_type:complete